MLPTLATFALFTVLAAAQCGPISAPAAPATPGNSLVTVPSPSGTVTIHPNGNTKYCLDVQGNVRANGTPVQVYECNGTGAQQWTVKKGSGAVQLAGTNYCLDAGSNPGNGIKMKIWQCYSGIPAQSWYYTDDNRIAVEGKGQCLDLTDGKASNANILQTWECSTGNNNQAWTTSSAPSRRSGPARLEYELEERANCDKAPLTPNGRKAGLAGGSAFDDFKDYIGWWYDWSAQPSGHEGTPVAVPMLWGNGHRGGLQNDWNRFSQFRSTWSSGNVPPYVLGFNEPDCTSGESSALSVSDAVSTWEEYIAPLGNAGALLISPAMCKQLDEDFLMPFQQAISTPSDVVAVHIYKTNVDDVKKVLDYYGNKYGKPMWVTEFGCVDDTSFTPCWEQWRANQFVNDVVNLFENDNRVYAYAPADVGNSWAIGSAGALTETGQTYLNAVKRYA